LSGRQLPDLHGDAATPTRRPVPVHVRPTAAPVGAGHFGAKRSGAKTDTDAAADLPAVRQRDGAAQRLSGLPVGAAPVAGRVRQRRYSNPTVTHYTRCNLISDLMFQS